MSDLIDRQLAHDVVDAEIIDANPEHFKANEKFIKFMNDEEVSSFGKWQWANGFNTAIVAALIQIKRIPSARFEIHFDEWCEDCKEYDHDKHCCPRFNKVIRQTVAEMKEAQPKTGKWIDYSDEGYVECPFCHSATNCESNKDELHYCFSCGAELR